MIVKKRGVIWVKTLEIRGQRHIAFNWGMSDEGRIHKTRREIIMRNAFSCVLKNEQNQSLCVAPTTHFSF